MFISFLKKFISFRVYGCFVGIQVCAPCVCRAQGGPERALDPLELELQVDVSAWCGFWALSFSSLQWQLVSLPGEGSFQPHPSVSAETLADSVLELWDAHFPWTFLIVSLWFYPTTMFDMGLCLFSPLRRLQTFWVWMSISSLRFEKFLAILSLNKLCPFSLLWYEISVIHTLVS